MKYAIIAIVCMSCCLSRADSLAGVWQTEYGPLRILKTDKGYEGFYGDGTVAGAGESDGWSTFTYAEGDTKGVARFKVVKDKLIGQWHADGNDKWKDWNGTRIKPGKQKYLVVLEAPWENGFTESPCAFADMLESHFTMTEEVAVRKMQVHDSDDVARFCKRVALMTEPVYLLVSSHGTRKGLTMNGKTIPAKAFASLKYCDNLKLLHLSGCSMMKGDHYKEIRKVAGDHFPISGYKIDVPWSPSALSDYVYLSQIFMDGKDPKEAVKRTHKLMPYTHETKALPGYPAMGLSIK